MEALYRALFQSASELSWSELEAALQEQKRSNCACSVQPSVKLVNADLWKEFHSNTNEMIITKAGRRMFPLLQLSLLNLEPTSTYVLLLALGPVDNRRWKFLNGEWQANEPGTCSGAVRGRASGGGEDAVYLHPFSPNTGEQWMRQSPVGFSRLKLSNRGGDGGRVKLSSLHRYQPLIYLVKLSSGNGSLQNHQDNHVDKETTSHSQLEITTHQFPEMQFIAVTAYQNDKITQMKIKHNPFAKAFLPGQDKDTTSTSIQVPPSSSQTQEGMLTTPQAQEEQCVTTPQAQEEQCITTSQAQEEQCVTTPQLQTTSLSPHEWWSTASHDHYGTPVQTLDPVRGYYSNMYAPPPCVPYYSQSMHTLPYHT